MSTAGPGTLVEARALASSAWRAGRLRVVRALGWSLLAGVLECAGVALLVPLLALVGLAPPDGALGRIGEGVAAALAAIGLPATLPVVLAAFVALAGAVALVERAQAVAAAELGAGVALELRRSLYASLARSSWPWFSRVRGSDAAHALTGEAERAGSAAQGLLALFAHGILAAAYLALALAAAPGIAGLAGIAGVAGVLAAARARAARRRGGAVSAADRAEHAALDDGLADARTDRAHGTTEEAVARYDAAAVASARARISVFRHLADSRALAAAGTAAVLAVFVLVSVEFVGAAPAALLLSLFLLSRLLHRTLALSRQWEWAAADLPGHATIRGMAAAAEAAAEPRDAAGAPMPLREGIRIRGVSFSWAGPDGAALRVPDLEIPAGSLAAITGPSGSGKTTLVDLVAGVLVPDEGRVAVDGVPLDAARLGSWSASVGYVAEDALLLHGTVRANLLRAVPGAADRDLWRALSLAGAADFVRARPGGLDAEVGERGRALSGGERRGIALARALLRGPSLLVLDGGADGADADEARRRLDALEGLRGTTTVLLVTGREEALRRADLVVRVRAGRAEAVPVPARNAREDPA